MNFEEKIITRDQDDLVVEQMAWRVRDVAKALGGLSVDHVYQLIHSGRLAHVKVGRHFLIPDAELKRFLGERA